MLREEEVVLRVNVLLVACGVNSLSVLVDLGMASTTFRNIISTTLPPTKYKSMSFGTTVHQKE